MNLLKQLKISFRTSYISTWFNKPPKDVLVHSSFIRLFFVLTKPFANFKLKRTSRTFSNAPIFCISLTLISIILTNLFMTILIQQQSPKLVLIQLIILGIGFFGFFVNMDIKTLRENSWFYNYFKRLINI